MKNLFRRMIKILDSQPAGARGQSLVELAFTTPILFLMIVSTAEVGYLANNYLILLDATREGARHAVTLSPITDWKDAETRNRLRTACYNTDLGLYNWTANQLPGNGTYYGPSNYPATTFNPQPGPIGFFDSTACEVVAALDPLKFNPFINTPKAGDTANDIVVSAISYFNSCLSGGAACYTPSADPNDISMIPTGTHTLVINGRWPLSNRMCSTDARDPFNYPGHPNTDPLPPAADGTFRGFVMTGKSPTFGGSGAACYGSKFNVGNGDANDLQVILNKIDNNVLNGTSVLNNVPNGGMVIVEISWQHHQLFGFPPLNFLGNPDLYIYQMFPVSSAEPTPTPCVGANC